VYDDLLEAPYIVRYILNYQKLIAPKYKKAQQFTLSYSKRLADYVGSPFVLHVPTVDLNFFQYRNDLKREGSCYYAHKYKEKNGLDPDNIPLGSLEILRSEKMSTEEVRKIFWTTEYFYCFEDSALATEAAICGCTVVFMPNKDFEDGPISSYELGSQGFAWGNGSSEIEKVKPSGNEVQERVETLYQEFPEKLIEVVRILKEQVREVEYKTPIVVPYDLKVIQLNLDFQERKDPSQEQRPLLAEELESRSSYKKTIKQGIKRFIGEWMLPPKIKARIKPIWFKIRGYK